MSTIEGNVILRDLVTIVTLNNGGRRELRIGIINRDFILVHVSLCYVSVILS